MKLISEGSLYDLLYAAYTYASYNAPSERINEYLVVNGIVPPNIRRDSQLSDVWRDYQQVLAELGFMYSTKVTGGIIRPTPSGLHLLDNGENFREILTTQVLLYQYPNGGKREYASEQIANGVLLRPAVLIWRILSILKKYGQNPILLSSEIRDYLMHCCSHLDTELCAQDLIQFRKTGRGLAPNLLTNAGRNASDWITLMTNTILFKQANSGNTKGIAFSNYALNKFEELDEIITLLEQENSFWKPSFIDNTVRAEWYSFYGALRLDVALPLDNDNASDDDKESDPSEDTKFSYIRTVNPKAFDPRRLNYNHNKRLANSGTIEASYDADMVANRHRLHDSMVIFIAHYCNQKGAEVLDDPKSLDLLVYFENIEYLIEVKTIAPNNYIKRLRYAIGQLLQYDFLLDKKFDNRRRVLAIPSLLPKDEKFLPFFNNHLDFDILSLIPTNEGQKIRCDSNKPESHTLFSMF